MKYCISKKIISTLLVIILCFNSFAAILSDDDSSSFVTKSEFDAVKGSFASQIKNYNDSVDKKIDGAIASYLQELELSNEPNVLIDKINTAVGGTLWFKNRFINVGQTTNTTEKIIVLQRHYTYKYFNNLSLVAKIDANNSTAVSQIIFGVTFIVSGSGTYGAHRIAYAERTGWGTGGSHTFGQFSSWNSIARNLTGETTTTANQLAKKEITTDGVGNGWIYEMRPSGSLILKQYCTQLYPRQEISVVAHTYLDKAIKGNTTFDTIYLAANGMGDKNALPTINIPQMSIWDEQEDGTKILTEDTTAQAQYYDINQYMIKNNDGIDYSVYMWGKNDNTSLCYLNNSIQPVVAGSASAISADDTKTTFKNPYYSTNGMIINDNELSGQAITYYPISINLTEGSASNFVNEFVTAIAGETVYIGGGIPIIETTNADQRLKIKLKFKKQDISGTSGDSASIKYKISDKQFASNEIAGGAKLLASGTTTAGTEVELEIEKDKQGLIWLTAYADTTSATDVAIDTLEVSAK